MREESIQSGYSIGAILTRGVESLTFACIATGDAFQDRQQIYVVFSAHVQVDSGVVGPAVSFFPTAKETTQCIMAHLHEARFAENHPGELYDPDHLKTYTAHILVASDSESNNRDEVDDNSISSPGPIANLTSDDKLAAYDFAFHVLSFRTKQDPRPTISLDAAELRSLQGESENTRQG